MLFPLLSLVALPALIAVLAVDALPSNLALIVDGNFKFILLLPLILTGIAVPEPSLLTIPIFLDVPQLFVVISAEPLKLVPLILRVFCNVVAELALPEHDSEVIACSTLLIVIVISLPSENVKVRVAPVPVTPVIAAFP